MPDATLYGMLDKTLAHDSRVSALMKRASDSYLPWDSFLAQRLPQQMSPIEMWRLLKSLNRSRGIDFTIPDLEGRRYWYTITHEITDALARIQSECVEGSSLHRRLMETQNRRVLIRSRIEETIAAARLDGLAISDRAAYRLLQLERTPRNDTERFVRNTLTALDHLDVFGDEPFSPELFNRLRELLIDAVDVDALGSVAPRRGLLPSDYSKDEVLAGSQRQSREFSDYANHITGDAYDHPIVRALLLFDVFRYYRPLPDVNSQVGRLVFRMYSEKMGLPVLGMLPLSLLKLKWEEGSLKSRFVTLSHDAYQEAMSKDGEDLTGYVTLTVQLALTALDELRTQLDKLDRQDSELRRLVQNDPEINHRQRSILGRALRNPNAEFRIAYHKTTHNVVYATARSDLLDLVERGFLEVGKSGRAMVFRPRPNLRTYIESTYQSRG